ncbi:MAG: tRNA threonylcarbamoyladenosine dehydratase [Olsenella sp.]
MEAQEKEQDAQAAGAARAASGADAAPGASASTVPGAAATPREETATDRLQIVLGREGLDLLRRSTVMVLGLGGVGSNCAVALARGGVGGLVLVDRDVVGPSNINRQAVARVSTLGRDKTEAMRELVADINPACRVTCLKAFIEKDRVAEQLGTLPRPDYVVDAIDTVAQKLAIARWCADEGLREISSMGGANKIDPTRFRVSDISRTEVDPLCRVMRKECRRGIKGLKVLWSDEVPLAVEPIDGPRDHSTRPADKGSILGTMSYIPPVMGQIIAGRVICDLVGLECAQPGRGGW